MKNNDDMGNEELINGAMDFSIKQAVEYGKVKGFSIGQTIAHPSDHLTYALKEIDGNIAVGWIDNNPDTIKKFPFNEIFDPNYLNDFVESKINEMKKLIDEVRIIK